MLLPIQLLFFSFLNHFNVFFFLFVFFLIEHHFLLLFMRKFLLKFIPPVVYLLKDLQLLFWGFFCFFLFLFLFFVFNGSSTVVEWVVFTHFGQMVFIKCKLVFKTVFLICFLFFFRGSDYFFRHSRWIICFNLLNLIISFGR